MQEVATKKVFKGQLLTGVAAFILCFVLACIFWPLWSSFFKAIFSILTAQGLAAVEPAVRGKLIGVMVEGSFFWLIICPGSGRL
ncbi:MAG: hypothetical protein RQM92_14785 [Candidatus Syntrophopropionicum ammoniitolerans]